jgi:hypothetical protein
VGCFDFDASANAAGQQQRALSLRGLAAGSGAIEHELGLAAACFGHVGLIADARPAGVNRAAGGGADPDGEQETGWRHRVLATAPPRGSDIRRAHCHAQAPAGATAAPA